MKKVRKIWVVAALVLLPVMSWAENKPEKVEPKKDVQIVSCTVTIQCAGGTITGYGEGSNYEKACKKAGANAGKLCDILTK